MKTQVLIIEDNNYKYFTTKAVLESQLKLSVNVVDVTMGGDIVDAVTSAEPDVIFFRPSCGVAELLEKLKKRHANRRNTEITLLVAEELDDDVARWLAEFTANFPRRTAAAKAA